MNNSTLKFYEIKTKNLIYTINMKSILNTDIIDL